jgi:hypothetical protein
VGSSRGPWPGSFYALPLAVALGVLAVLVAIALRAIVARPRPDLDSRGLDTLLRRWSAGNVLTAATVTVLGILGPVLTPTIRVDDLPRPLPGDVAPVGAPVR